MADFSFSMDMDKIFPKGIQDEKLALDMIDAGQEIMLKAIQKGANKHRDTGEMAESLKKSKPVIDKNGDAVGRVKFYGKDRNGMLNWYKAIRLEYGRTGENAKPFIRPAIKGSENAAKSAMQRVFNQKTKG